ncbi:MAG: beta strand repeat-containing protein, partial [Stenotrophomonas sp.]
MRDALPALGPAVIACAGLLGASVDAVAQSTVVIDTNRTTTVVLPAGGGNATVAAGITVAPTTGYGILGGVGDAWLVTNLGTVTGVQPAVQLQGNGSRFINSGTVGGTGFGVYNNNAALAVENSGTISTGNIGVYTSGELTLSNTGLIKGTVRGIYGSLPNAGVGASITNTGVIEGGVSGIELTTGSSASTTPTITNNSGGRISALNAGGLGISVSHGSTLVTNAAGGLIQGPGSAVAGTDLFTDLMVDNAGVLSSTTGPAIWSYGGGEITNRAGGQITGAGGIAYVRSRFNTGNVLTNAGTITATSSTFVGGNGATAGSGAAVYIGASYALTGAQVINQAGGSLIGPAYGVYSGNATLADDSGPVTVDNAGLIRGNVAIALNNAPGTVINAGSLESTGTVAVQFDQTTAYDDRMTLRTGSRVVGTVLAGPGTDTLFLEGTGTETAALFQAFELLRMQGQDWTLSGTGTFAQQAFI